MNDQYVASEESKFLKQSSLQVNAGVKIYQKISNVSMSVKYLHCPYFFQTFKTAYYKLRKSFSML